MSPASRAEIDAMGSCMTCLCGITHQLQAGSCIILQSGCWPAYVCLQQHVSSQGCQCMQMSKLKLSASPLQVARCTKIINPGTDEAKYVINVKQIAKVGDGFSNFVASDALLL